MRRLRELAHPALDEVIRRHGIEEIADIPAVPATGGLRYARAVRLEPDGEPWYLRSHGTDFRMIPQAWLRRGPRRCCSLGHDLAADGESDGLLLVQAFTEHLAEAEHLGEELVRALPPGTEEPATRVGLEWGRPCLWLSARIGRPADGGAHD